MSGREVGIAAALAVSVIVLAPGLAIVALIAGAVLAACAVSLGVGRRGRRRPAARRRVSRRQRSD